MGPVFTGEVRYMELDFANDPGVAGGAALASAPAIAVLEKRGEAPTTGVVLDGTTTPVRAAPAISGNTIRFWILAPAAGRYIVRGTATLNNTEIAKAREDLVVE